MSIGKNRSAHQYFESQMSLYSADVFSSGNSTQAAVLVPIVLNPEPAILLTLRASHLKSHPGQVSFPGGMLEQADGGSMKTAALRETDEEIGLSADRFQVIGELSTTISKDGVLVYPVVGTIASAEGSSANPDEIAEIFTVPWQFFIDAEPDFQVVERLGRSIEIPHYYYQDRHIWGLTAMVLLELLNTVEGTQWPIPPFSKMHTA